MAGESRLRLGKAFFPIPDFFRLILKLFGAEFAGLSGDFRLFLQSFGHCFIALLLPDLMSLIFFRCGCLLDVFEHLTGLRLQLFGGRFQLLPARLATFGIAGCECRDRAQDEEEFQGTHQGMIHLPAEFAFILQKENPLPGLSGDGFPKGVLLYRIS